jgi:cytochrome b6-f complex iron-sulfur subunit
VGSLDDINAGIAQNSGFFYVPEARTWITAYPAEALPQAETVYAEPVLVGMRAGLNALYQKCPHLGCRVPECASSQWFECPCHGSQYNRAGEKKAGPAPRGMDRFGLDISGGNVSINTGLIFQGPSIGTNTTGQEAEGPHCVSGGEGGH